MTKTLLVTGSSSLIGSEVCAYFARELGYAVHGLDNNHRALDVHAHAQRVARHLAEGSVYDV